MAEADVAMWLALLVATLRAAAPLILAGLGELVAERSGVLNLGVEGMMLVGAVAGFAAAVTSGSVVVGLLAAMLAGAAMAGAFAALTLGLQANQVAAGLSLTIFGVGFSALVGAPFQGRPMPGLATVIFPGLSAAPPLLQQVLLIDPLVLLALAGPVAAHLLLGRSRAGLVLRAVGENAAVAHALGYKVRLIRLAATLFGGAMAGLGGAYLSLAYTPMWTENMVAGRGWIAVALVVFATWKPLWLVAGACLFGCVTIAGFQAAAWGIPVAPNLLATLPYLATIIVLVAISRDRMRLKLNAPADLGRNFHPDS